LLAVSIAQIVAHKMGESILFMKSSLAALHKLLGGTGHWGDRMHCMIFFALCIVGQIRIWCIFIARRNASMVYAVVVCGVDVAYRHLCDRP